MDIPSNNIWLVVEKSSMKNMSSSIGMDDSSQDIWKKNMFQTTNQTYIVDID